ncbi:LLM class F420-dependent oxidoreductase [Streptomyces sp. NPDC002896]|uniref:LLM class F420-dependent oxidoreductase n=1 Tax=Streptomyces sp. NPDC002896 TaxID=3154438 RepID=UPI00332FF8F0
MDGTSTPDIGRYGIFSALVHQPPTARDETAAELEELGFGAIWLANATVDDVAPVIAATSKAVVGTAIQSIWRHEAAPTAARCAALEAAHPGRFLLGLGVGHPQRTAGYKRPYAAMTGFLDALDDTDSGTPVPAGRRVLAALGPKMLGLSRDRAAGALPYLATAEQVAGARELLGDGPLLAPELGVVLESDPERARQLARAALERYLKLANYTNNWLRGGFTEDDLTGGGSDRLVDALFAWGDEKRIRARIDAFHTAGADHVVVQLIGDHSMVDLPSDSLRRLAGILH